MHRLWLLASTTLAHFWLSFLPNHPMTYEFKQTQDESSQPFLVFLVLNPCTLFWAPAVRWWFGFTSTVTFITLILWLAPHPFTTSSWTTALDLECPTLLPGQSLLYFLWFRILENVSLSTRKLWIHLPNFLHNQNPFYSLSSFELVVNKPSSW